MELQEGFIICTASMKEKILKETNGFKNYIFLSQKELNEKVNFIVKKKAIYLLMRHYGFSYDLALEYIHALYYIEDKTYCNPKLDGIVSVFRFLKQENMIEKDNLFLIRLKQYPVTFIDPEPTKEYFLLKKEVSNYTHVVEVYPSHKKYIPTVYEFKSILDESLFIMNQIKKLLQQNVSLNKIFIINADDSYVYLLKRLSKSYQIPIQFGAYKNVNSSVYIQNFYKECMRNSSFTAVLNQMDSNHSFYSILIDTLNSFELMKENPIDCISFFKSRFKMMSFPNSNYVEAIHLVTEDMIFQETDYIFYVGFNLGSSPKIEKENGFLNDSDLELLLHSTSYDKNQIHLKRLQDFIEHTPNLTLSYKLQVNQEDCLPSLLIEQMGLQVIQMNDIPYGYAQLEDELRLVGLYDLYLKYGQWHPDLEQYGIQGVSYKSYKHEYQGLPQEVLDAHFSKKPLRLAYSNVKLYFACPFSYYADRILGLNEYKPQMAARMGTFSHAVLEDSYKKNFNFLDSVELHKKENAIDEKDIFFFEQMTEVLRNLIDFNHSHESQSQLSTIVREPHIEIIKDNFTFEGYVDKLMYCMDGNDVYAAIVDYKTGSDIINLDNIEDGFHLQLPAYMFLLSHYEPFLGKKLHILGIYLQKVNIVIYNHKSRIEDQMTKKFMLEGYSVAEPRLLQMLDPTYEHSTYIKSLGLGKDGFLRYSKVYLESQQEEIISMIEELLDQASIGIHQGEFPIAPKRIQGKNMSCTFCKYKDLCFCDFEDEVELEYKPFGKTGDMNGMD